MHLINSTANFQMTKNIRFLYFSFVFKDLLAWENACNSVCSGRRAGATVNFTGPFFMGNSNTRPDMDVHIGPRGRVLYQTRIWKLTFFAEFICKYGELSNLDLRGGQSTFFGKISSLPNSPAEKCRLTPIVPNQVTFALSGRGRMIG